MQPVFNPGKLCICVSLLLPFGGCQRASEPAQTARVIDKDIERGMESDRYDREQKMIKQFQDKIEPLEALKGAAQKER
jgi:hypothetical protein